MAQRMESVAPPGGVMLSASTARLVDGVATLGEPELVQIKGADEPVPARRLLAVGQASRAARAESKLVGRRWEMSAVEGLLDRAIDGDGAVVGVVGPAGIGKSRLTRELAAMAATAACDVFATFCESHTSQVPFHVVARLLRRRPVSKVSTRRRARADRGPGFADADPEDVALFEDLLGIGDPDARATADRSRCRRRRLTAMVNSATLAARTPAVYVIEDAHWIDESSESMLADFLTVVPQTPLLTLITYRPEYRGALAQVPGAQTIALAPLSEPRDRGTGFGTARAGPLRSRARPDDRRKSRRHTVLRGGDRSRTRGTWCAAREIRRIRVNGRSCRGSCARHVAGNDRLPHRSARPESETNAERGGGGRLAVRSGPAVGAGRRTRGRRLVGGPAHRSGHVHPAPRVCVSPSADTCGGLRGSAQIRPRRIAPAGGHRDRTTQCGIS